VASVLVITTSGERPLREVARDLAKAGLNVSEVLDEIGSIIGTADDAAVKKLRKVRGVADVSHDTSVDIGPPGAPETW
jgi:hypothetical protein